MTRTPVDTAAELRELLQTANAERLFPYVSGDDLNESPTHAPRRYVINFAELSLDEARRWPDLLSIVERKVRPEREKLADNRMDDAFVVIGGFGAVSP